MNTHSNNKDLINANVANIPCNYSRLIARALGLQTHDLPSLLTLTTLSTEQFLQEDLLLTAQQQIQILHNALALSNDPAFGLRLGKQLTLPTHGALGFLVNSSRDLLTALRAFQAYSPTRMNFIRLELITKGEWLECHYHIDFDMSPEIHRSIAEASAVTFFQLAEFILGRPLEEAKIYFSHTQPDYSQCYAQYLPGQYEFSASRIILKIPLALCKEPNVSANHENYLLALRQCETMLADLYSNKDTCKYKIQKMMLSHLPGALCEEEAAAMLFVTKRTLARRLQREGTGFRKIREEILSQQAIGYLRDSEISVDAIAALLNYHDSANFRRAFKRWFQVTPDQYRKKLV